MAKKPAAVALTGGRGFAYEDQVAGFFLANMLSAHAFLGAEFGCVRSVEFQVDDCRWLLDDLLIHFESSDATHHLALSVKSDKQVTRNGFPRDFVRACWEHWLSSEATPFRHDKDVLALVVGRVAHEVKAAWDDVVREAKSTDAHRLAERLSGHHSKLHRDLYASFACPDEFRHSGGQHANDVGQLVSRVRLLHFDFLAEPSESTARALELCRSIAEAGSPEEGSRLWGRLIAVAAERRPLGGTLELATLVDLLRPEFQLATYPNHKTDWDRVDQVTRSCIGAVRTTLGAGLRVDRSEVLQRISGAVNARRALALLGESGSGKSAIAKDLASTPEVTDCVVWLHPDSWDLPGMGGVSSSLGLRSDLIDVLRTTSARRPMLIVDGAERLSDAALARVAETFRALIGGKGGVSSWRILITAETHGYGRVARQLLVHEVQPNEISFEPVPLLSEDEVRRVLASVDKLRHLAGRSESRVILRNLKVLDFVLIAAATRPLSPDRPWVGISDVMDWVWEFWLEAGPAKAGDSLARAELLKELGERDGSGLAGTIPVSDVQHAALRTLGELVEDGIVRRQDERFRFDHDLVGDWARVRLLVGIWSATPDCLLQRSPLPRWHRAIRFFGQRLLEQSPGGVEEWIAAVRACDGQELPQGLARDLLLESVLLAANAGELLERTWPELVANGGELLIRMLRIFLHSATIPDPRFTQLASTAAEASAFASSARLPYWSYWPPLLSALARHIEDLESLPGCFESAARICELWLRSTPAQMEDGRSFPWRREAATVALRLAREVQALKVEKVYSHDDVDEVVYTAMLHASPDLPDEVGRLSLQLVHKQELDESVRARRDAYEREQAARQAELESDPAYLERLARLPVSIGASVFERGERRPPWPEGPTDRVDTAFQKVCWRNAAAFTALVSARPAVARDVLLGACIEPPGFEDPYGVRSHMFDRYGTESVHDGSLPMYFQGPYLSFLRAAPTEALEFILRLANFATERWAEAERRFARQHGEPIQEGSPRFEVMLDGNVADWLGDHRVFSWYRHILMDAECVVSSLMALEKWLYEELDAGNDTGAVIRMILERSRSAAFAGVLVAVGLRQPSLFAGPLLPLLGMWQLYGWQDWQVQQGDVWRIGMMGWSRWSESIFNLVRDWHTLPHRRLSLRDEAIKLMLTRQEVQAAFESVRERWSETLASENDHESLELLLARFDRGNYRLVPRDEHSFEIQFEWPASLKARTEARLAESQRGMLVLGFPFRCRQLLDGEAALSRNEVETFYEQLQQIAALRAAAHDGIREASACAAVCGGVAVLTILHRDWLAADPAREVWCREQIQSILDFPPPQGEFDTPESVSTTACDSFLAELFVVLLSEDSDDPSVRELAANCACGFHYAATKLAMQRAFRCRQQLGRDFVRLQNLVVLWAGVRAVMQTAHLCQASPERWHNWYRRLILAFRDRHIGELPLKWARVARIGRRAMHRIEKARFPGIDDADDASENDQEPLVATGELRRRGRWSMHPGLDVQLIRAAFDWLSPLEEDLSTPERSARLGLLEEAIGVTLSMLPDTEESGELRGTPYEYDRWVFEKAAIAVARMAAEENAARLWQPILNLGAPAHYWVSSFLSAWFVHGVRAAASVAEYVDRWREMMKFALESPRWGRVKGQSSFRLYDLMIEVMGLSWFNRSVDDERFACYLACLKPEYERFAEGWLSSPHVAAAFAAFLSTPAARDLRLDGMIWLDRSVAGYDPHDWRTDRLSQSLLEALRTTWHADGSLVATRPAVRDAFVRLLGELAARQLPGALQLRDEVNRVTPNV